jgi:acetolactate decarboxylase
MKNFKTKQLLISGLSVLIAVSSVSARSVADETARRAADKAATVFQFSTLPALSLGLYDGGMTFGAVLQRGDFGLGTFDALDGEGIILNGRAWRVRSDGKVSAVATTTTTPFAVVTFFKPQQSLKVQQPAEYSALRPMIDKLLSTANTPYAIAVRGTFARVKVRSVPRQNKPYPALSEVVKTQSEWEWKNIQGTLVGFRFPAYLSQVNLADYHFHFLSDDHVRGGHLLDCALESGEIEVQALRGIDLQLPTGKAFDSADLAADQSVALKASEQNH